MHLCRPVKDARIAQSNVLFCFALGTLEII